MKILGLFCILFLIGCNLDVNTSDPQASNSIKDSKKDKLLIKVLSIDTTKSSCFIDEAWIEYSWRNQVKYGKLSKFKPGGIQLVIKSNQELFSLDPAEYLWSWEFVDSVYGPLASYSGLYTLGLNEKHYPNSFEIYLEKQRPYKLRLCKILLYAKE